MIDPLDIKVVATAMHDILKKKGFDSFVPEAEVQAMAQYLVQTLDFDRAHRKSKIAAPDPLKLARAGLQNPSEPQTA